MFTSYKSRVFFPSKTKRNRREKKEKIGRAKKFNNSLQFSFPFDLVSVTLCRWSVLDYAMFGGRSVCVVIYVIH